MNLGKIGNQMFFYNDGERAVGPFSKQKLVQLAQGGLISSGTLVREGEDGPWLPLNAVQFEPAHLTETSRDISPSRVQPVTVSEADAHPTSLNDSGVTKDGVSKEHPSDGDRQKKVAEAKLDRPDIPSKEELLDTDEPSNERKNVQAGWNLEPPRAWRRYGARILDTNTNGLIGFYFISVVFYLIAPNTADDFFGIFDGEAGIIFDSILTGLVASIVGGAIIGTSGFTLGKLVFGIKITDGNGSTIGIRSGIARDLEVLMKGLGFCVPIVTLFTMISSYSKLKASGQTDWDQGRYLVWSRPDGGRQTALNAVGVVLIVLVVSLTLGLASL